MALACKGLHVSTNFGQATYTEELALMKGSSQVCRSSRPAAQSQSDDAGRPPVCCIGVALQSCVSVSTLFLALNPGQTIVLILFQVSL